MLLTGSIFLNQENLAIENESLRASLANKDEKLDHKVLFEIHRKATALAIHKAMANKPDIDWLLENQDKITHKYYQMGLDGKL